MEIDTKNANGSRIVCTSHETSSLIPGAAKMWKSMHKSKQFYNRMQKLWDLVPNIRYGKNMEIDAKMRNAPLTHLGPLPVHVGNRYEFVHKPIIHTSPPGVILSDCYNEECNTFSPSNECIHFFNASSMSSEPVAHERVR